MVFEQLMDTVDIALWNNKVHSNSRDFSHVVPQAKSSFDLTQK